MGVLGGLSWKEFYHREREAQRHRILDRMEQIWVSDDPDVVDVCVRVITKDGFNWDK